MYSPRLASSNERDRARFLLALCSLLLVPAVLRAEASIGNGKLFSCNETTITSVKTGANVPVSRAIAKYKRIVKKQKIRIASSSRGSKKRARAVAARKVAKQGLRDVKRCRDGELGSLSQLLGMWNVLTEDGMTPAENGYTSLTLSFTANSFVSDLDGESLDCHWEGTYTTSSGPDTAILSTTVGTGGAACSQAIGQARTATISLSDDGNTLTLDYTPNGTLQVYERVS